MTIEKIISLINTENFGEVYQDVDLSKHCSIKIGGSAKVMYMPNSIDNLLEVIKVLQTNDIKYKVIGRGSNIILPNRKLDMVFIKISNVLDFINISENGVVEVGAGYSFQKFAKTCSKDGLSGLEFAGGIPGTVGGAIFMNAGAHLLEVKDIVREVTIIDENNVVRSLTNDECNFSYRHSIFQNKDYIIVSAKFKLEKKDKAEVFKKMLGNLEYRKEMQPLDKPTFGSVFKNPKDNHAGKLIEEVGLKGFKIGAAQVSEKHANFIENAGGATSQDIIDLIKYIKEKVKNEKNIDLITEVEMFEEE